MCDKTFILGSLNCIGDRNCAEVHSGDTGQLEMRRTGTGSELASTAQVGVIIYSKWPK